MSRPKSICMFSNGQTAVHDEDGKQVPDLQEPWLMKYLEWLVLQPEMTYRRLEDLEINLPSGNRAIMVRTSQGEWNWRVE